ncbi:uncharacterized protein LOC144494663 [Mustelus asterias]
MALASGHWIKKEVRGEPPCPRHGHGLAVAGNIAFIFGGCSTVSMKVSNRPKYFGDFYMLTVTPSDLSWEIIPQSGYIPSSREGHSMCVVKGKIYLFGGRSYHLVEECLPGMYCFDIESLTWEKLQINGIAPCTLNHSAALVGDNIFVFGGIQNGAVSDDLFMFNTVSLTWTPVKTMGLTPAPRYKEKNAGYKRCCFVVSCDSNEEKKGPSLVQVSEEHLPEQQEVAGLQEVPKAPKEGQNPLRCVAQPKDSRYTHTFATVGELLYLFGGSTVENLYYKDIHVLDTADKYHSIVSVSLTWSQCEVKGEGPSGRGCHTFTSHHDKDIYVFGGSYDQGESITTLNDVVKLSLAKMKWKMPLYVGISPARRHNHAAFVLHSHLYIFGGVNEEQEFNDIKAMKLINPSDRQPIMKEIFSEFGINEVSNRFSPTRIPKVKYELAVCPFSAQLDSPPPVSATESRDLSSVYKQAIEMITNAFAMLDVEFQKLDIEKGELTRAKIAFQQEKEAYNKQYRNQQQELQEMLEKHKAQNEAWLKARAEQNDRERQELFNQRVELLQEQEKLHEEQKSLQMRSQQLLSLMQQFKGM